MSGPSAEVLRARAYLSRVAEPPSPALIAPSQPLGQATVSAGAQAPAPLQCAATVASPSAQAASRHTTAAPG